MDRTEIEDFAVKLNKDDILRAVGCGESGAARDMASRCFDELKNELAAAAEPYAAAVKENDKIYCLLTLGDGVSKLIDRLFTEGEAVKGLVADAMADAYLFEIDALLTERIKRECAVMNVGVGKRLTAPDDFPLSEQTVIISKIGTNRVTVTDAFMLNPVKSMAYALELTDDRAVFNAQHDCSKCAAKDCPMRKTEHKGEFSILSGYSYAPENTVGSAVCIDIGTTTVVFEYIENGKVTASHKVINPQRRFGHDVISRIEAANRGRGAELASDIRYALINGYNAVMRGKTPDRAVIAANTTMVHLLMEYDCAPLGQYPFTARTDTVKTTFDKVTASQCAPVPTLIFGGISAFVGGDITSGLYMCDFDLSDSVNLFIDLGTNGEMVIGNKDKMLAASTAAGPAFEGGLISCGTGSVDGAVCSVRLNPPRFETIGGKPPVGICGTGIIELVSEMRDCGVIDGTGKLCDKYFASGFPVTDKITFTQNDIRQVQTAKSAVRAGIECLVRAYGANYDDIGAVYIAGGFGYGLSVKKACNIGLLPAELADKAVPVGNSSLGGCVKMTARADGEERIKRIQNVSSDLPLASDGEFNKLYIKYMNF